MTEMPVKYKVGSQNLDRPSFLLKVGFMIIVHLVVASRSPVCLQPLGLERVEFERPSLPHILADTGAMQPSAKRLYIQPKVTNERSPARALGIIHV